MLKESKLEQSTKKANLNLLKQLGACYSLILGSTTVGAIGGAVYSLCTGDYQTGRDIACGAILGFACEPTILFINSLEPTE